MRANSDLSDLSDESDMMSGLGKVKRNANDSGLPDESVIFFKGLGNKQASDMLSDPLQDSDEDT